MCALTGEEAYWCYQGPRGVHCTGTVGGEDAMKYFKMRPKNIRICSVLALPIMLSLAHGCGANLETVNGERNTLGSNIIDDGLIGTASQTGEFSDFRIVANESTMDAKAWSFTITGDKTRIADGLTFEWSFGDGTTQLGQDQSYTFGTVGNHTVSVRGIDSRGTTLFILSLEVIIPELGMAPMARAGADVTILEGGLVELDGSASSDPEGDSLTYLWSQVGAGAAVTLNSTSTAKVSFMAPDVTKETSLQFTLTVSDGSSTAQDVAIVTVLDSQSSRSNGVVADAGVDLSVASDDFVTLDGSQSTGGGVGPLGYRWRQTTGTPVTLNGTTTATASFIAPSVLNQEILVFVLTVTQDGKSAIDDTIITVSPLGVASTPPGGDTNPDPVSDLCPNDSTKTVPGVCGCGVPDTDSDLDGTADCNDACPGDPLKTAAGSCGCGVSDVDTDSNGTPDCNDICPPGQNGDSDSDGVQDCRDGCPNDGTKTAPGVCGCGVANTDTDGDGTADCIDVCPSDPNKILTGVCGCGTADTNSDGDSVADCNDGCPNDANKTNAGTCGCGVSDADNNGNGVADCLDVSCSNNLLADPGFESGGSVWPGYTNGGRSIVTTPVHAGTRAQQMLVHNTFDRTVWQNISVLGNSSYDASGWVRTSKVNGNGSHIRIEWLNSSGSILRTDVLGTLTGTNAWTQLIGSYTSPTSAATARFALYTDIDSDGLGTAWFDDNVFCGSSADTDGDGVNDPVDLFPSDPNRCRDADGDGCDDCSSGTVNINNDGLDSDNDGICNVGDLCPGYDDSIDANNNGTPDGCDPVQLCTNITTLNLGLSASQSTFRVWNCGGGTLGYTVSDNKSWLSVNPTSGSSTGEQDTITVSVNRSGLADGTYQGDVTVVPSVGAAVAVMVTMTVSQASGVAPNVSFSVTKSSGVSPLGVIFDASATTSTATSRPFHDLDFTWDFGDPGSSFNNRPDIDPNFAKNGIAGHVFELPTGVSSKVYTVTLTARDSSGTTAQVSQLITVNAFSGFTYYVSNSTGSDSNSGQSTSAPFKTWAKGMNMLTLAGGARRVLLNRGDTFAATSETTFINRTGPYIIGAYGTGARPIISVASGISPLDVRGSMRGMRVMDLNFVGTSGGSAMGTGQDHLVLRCRTANMTDGIINCCDQRDDAMIVDSTFFDHRNYGIYYNRGKHVGILACDFDMPNNKEHNVRTYISNCVVSYNIFRRNVARGHHLKFVGLEAPNKVEYAVVSENIFLQANSNWSVSFGPQNTSRPEIIENLIIEGNIWQDPGTVCIQSRGANDVTVRNNVFTNFRRALLLGPIPSGLNTFNRWHIYNNTAYSNLTGSTIFFMTDLPMTDLRVQNNIMSSPNASVGTSNAINAGPTSVSQITASNNIWHYSSPGGPNLFKANSTFYNFSAWQSLGKDANSMTILPRFTSPGVDMQPTNLSPAINNGVELKSVQTDFNATLRPLGTKTDIGAYEKN